MKIANILQNKRLLYIKTKCNIFLLNKLKDENAKVVEQQSRKI